MLEKLANATRVEYTFTNGDIAILEKVANSWTYKCVGNNVPAYSGEPKTFNTFEQAVLHLIDRQQTILEDEVESLMMFADDVRVYWNSQKLRTAVVENLRKVR